MQKINFKIIALGLIVGLAGIVGVNYVLAQWSAPDEAPPEGNVFVPVNVGDKPQDKNGVFRANGLRSFVDLYVDEKVGIGTTNPNTKLHIVGNDGVQIQRADNSGFANVYFRTGTNDNTRSSIGFIPAGGANDLVFRVGNLVERMRITSNGNVGIGTTNPGARLEVNGQVKITGGSPGADKVLTSDANGLASWATPSGGLPGGVQDNILRHNGTNWVSSNNFRINDAGVLLAGSVPWARLTNFPAGCPSGQFVRAVGTTLTCETPAGGGGSNFWTQSGNLLFPNNTAWNVGLGTPNPNTKLHVVGQTRIEAGEGANLLFRSDGPFHTRLESVGNINLRPGNRSENSMTLTNVNGFVGIGEFSPKSTLYVKRMGGTPTASFYGGGAGSDTHIAIVTQEGNGTVGSRGGQPQPWVHGWSLIGRNNNHNLAFGFWEGGNTGNWVNQPMELTPSGNLTIQGEYFKTSDSSLKTNIQNLSDSLAKILELRGVTFNWKNRVDEKENIGFIAQEIEKIFPELVHGEDGQKSVNYVSLVPVLVEAVKELDEKNKELEARLEKLEKRLGISF